MARSTNYIESVIDETLLQETGLSHRLILNTYDTSSPTEPWRVLQQVVGPPNPEARWTTYTVTEPVDAVAGWSP